MDDEQMIQRNQTIMMTQYRSERSTRLPLIHRNYSIVDKRSQRTSICQSRAQQEQTNSIRSFKSVKSMKSTKSYFKNNKKQLNESNSNKRINLPTMMLTDPNYEIFDLTYTFVTLKMNHWSITALFIFLILIRYYTIASLIYVFIENNHNWGWIIDVVLVRLVFVLIVIKISLKIPQSRTQLILKKNWNCMVSQAHEYFEVMQPRKFLTSMLRGFVPPQMSFIYISSQNSIKKFEIFSAINYINASIEAVVYYPFFIIYTQLIDGKNFQSLNFGDPGVSIVTIVVAIAQAIIVGISIYLIIIGCQRKYGSILRLAKNINT